MLRASVTAYPWDLIDEDPAKVLDRLHGEVGLSGVSVWAASPPVLQLRARDVSPRVFRTRGGLFFHPDERHYADTRCKPILSGWLKGRHHFKRIEQCCAERGMELCAIVSAGMTGRIAQRHPEMACKNAFDDASHAALCLANPDVQAYLCGLVADLSSSFQLAGLEVADFRIAWAEAFRDGLRSAVPPSDTFSALLSTCFCESCYQRASAVGVDVAMARRAVQTVLQGSFDIGVAVDGRIDVLLADNEPLAEYYHWRTRELESLLVRLADACRCDLLLSRRISGAEGHRHAELDLSAPAGVVTRIDQSDQLTSALSSGARRNEVRLSERLAAERDGQELVTILARAAQLGFAGVQIDNYGLLPEGALTHIKQAIRFARRSTAEK